MAVIARVASLPASELGEIQFDGLQKSGDIPALKIRTGHPAL